MRLTHATLPSIPRPPAARRADSPGSTAQGWAATAARWNGADGRSTGSRVRSLYGNLRGPASGRAAADADVRRQREGPSAVSVDAAGDVSFALCLQCPGRLAIAIRGQLAAAAWSTGGDTCGAGFVWPDHRVLFGQHDQLSVHEGA